MAIITRQKAKKISRETVSQYCPILPQVLIFEILTRVSLETLERCRLVSKEWNHLTHDPKFMKHYCKRTGVLSGFFTQYCFTNRYTRFASQGNPVLDGSSLSLGFLPTGSATVLAVSNQGLIYCMTVRRSYYVCKPTTREWVKIPDPKTRLLVPWGNAMVVLHSRPLHYKIVGLLKPQDDARRRNTIICEIFDSAKGRWKRLKNIKSSDFVLLYDGPPVFVSGAFHWFTYSQQIFAFNIISETWELIDLPKEFTGTTNFYLKKPLVQCQGKLAVLRYGEEKVEIWVLESYSRRIWKLEREIGYNADQGTIIHLYTSDFAVMVNNKDLIWHDFKNGTSTTARSTDVIFPRNIFPFESDYQSMFA